MFVWSIRASTLKFFTAILASAFILCLLVVLVPVSGGEAEGQLAAISQQELVANVC